MRNYILPFLFLIAAIGCSFTTQNVKEKAKEIHKEIVTVDMHTDTPLMLFRDNFDISGRNDFNRGKVDFKKMEEGGLDGAFFAVFIGQGERAPEKYIEANQRALEIFDSIHTAINRFPDEAEIAYTPNDVYRLKEKNKRAIYIGVENGYPIGTDISILKDYYQLGARYLTLSHTRNNQICDSSTDSEGPEHNGLSPFGKDVVKELNRLGMIIDVSHISDEAFFQVIELSKAPVIASHSNARAICNSPRNLTDEMIIKLANNGGVINVCLLSAYVKTPEPQPLRDSARAALRKKYNNFQELSPETRKQAVEEWYQIDEVYPPKYATVSDLIDHIDHIVNLVGIDYVGIGSDFDGGGAIKGCMDASEMINITAELLQRNYTQSDIKKIWGGNFFRVFKEVESYSKNL